MVTAVTKYAAEDGSLHDTEEAAAKHENATIRTRLANALYQNISDPNSYSYKEVLESIVELFTVTNTRNMIKEMYDITADSFNER